MQRQALLGLKVIATSYLHYQLVLARLLGGAGASCRIIGGGGGGNLDIAIVAIPTLFLFAAPIPTLVIFLFTCNIKMNTVYIYKLTKLFFSKLRLSIYNGFSIQY